jgi:endonuclease IV|tara:strand:+ start:340 stop:504 length:165 start_codon:yes stop_codon:yes gene_type:complete
MTYFIRKESVWKKKSQEQIKIKQRKERRRVEKYILHKNYYTNHKSDDGKTEKTT